MKLATDGLVLAALTALACASSPEPQEPASDAEPASAAPASAAVEASAAPAEPAADPKQLAEAKKKEEEKKKLADDFAKLERDKESEKARFSEAVRKELVDITTKNHASFKAAMEAAMKGSYRTPGWKDRDAERRPIELLSFFGVKQDSQVLELDPGAGWFTELLAPVLRKKGKLAVAAPNPDGPTTERPTFYAKRMRALLDRAPEFGEKVEYVVADASKGFEFDPALSGRFDVVLAFRAVHNWTRRDALDKNLAQVFRVLKPGGVFAVEAHRAKPDADPKASAEKGYLPEAFVIARAKAAGFDLGGSSELNANPKDTKDHPEGVWSLPPTLREGEKDKAKYLAIGESDRMTLKFVKPKVAKK